MKTIIYVLMALIIMSAATAVTVDCGPDKWYNVISKHCEADELQPTLDELEEDVNTYTDQKVKKVKKNLNKKINAVDEYIDEHQEDWGEDISGVKWNSVKRRLYGNYLNYLKELFAPLSIVEDVISAKKSAERFEAVNYYIGEGYNPVYWKGNQLYGRAPNGVLYEFD